MRVKSLHLAAPAVLALLAGCSSTPGQYDNHWNIGSLGPRIAYHGFGYKPHLSDSYREHQWKQKQHINLTLRRHFLNNNPENPFQPPDPSLSEPRPPHSILPNPVSYFHLEAILIGAAISGGASFVPLPVGSILGTLEEGGAEEFGEGISQTLQGEFRGSLEEPAPPSEFRVKNTRP